MPVASEKNTGLIVAVVIAGFLALFSVGVLLGATYLVQQKNNPQTHIPVPSAPNTQQPIDQQPISVYTFDEKQSSEQTNGQGGPFVLIMWAVTPDTIDAVSVPDPGQRYIAVFVGAAQKGYESVHINPLCFLLSDDRGVAHSAELFATTPSSLKAVDISNNDYIAGTIVFQVPYDTKSVSVRFQPLGDYNVIVKQVDTKR